MTAGQFQVGCCLWPGRRLTRAFTLIELLVVVAIICLLLAMVTPTLSRAKHLTRTIVCNSNMHQLVLAHRLYTMSQKEILMRESVIMDAHPYPQDPAVPYGSSKWVYWPDLIRKYHGSKEVMDCPAVQDKSLWSYGGKRLYGIGLNHIELSYSPWVAFDGPGAMNITMSMIQRPDRSFIFADTARILNYGEPNPDLWVEERAQQFIWCLTPNHPHFASINPHRAVNRHLGKCSTGFLEGHIETIPVSQIGLQYFPGLAPDGGEARGENILGMGNGKYDLRWLWGRG